MSENPRDTQFKGFAEAMFSDVESMFNNRYIELDNCEEQEAEKTKQDIIKCFAECAYDLACHVATHTLVTAHGDMGKVPDLTELPKE